MNAGAKEKRFLDALESLFTGAEVEGDSGFINLMRMKRGYFKSIRPQLMAAIDKRAAKDTAFREELFDKLHTFFSRYFCESGSIYFRHLPAFSKTYERVYADGEDVALSWKTRMLYYVKSDVLVRSMPVKLEDKENPERTRLFYFNASAVEHKKNNERREFIFAFAKGERTTEGPVVHLHVAYSQKGRKTNLESIIKQAKNAPGARVNLTEDDLQTAFRVFRRQTEADYFINKDARGFLREQFDLWLYQYMFQEESVFEQPRLNQLQALQRTAYDIIDFIAQFEDELRRAWEKPKFVRNVNYVVTLDRLTDAVLNKIIQHTGVKAQIKEWRALGMVDASFSMPAIFNGQKSIDDTNGVVSEYKFLPLDTQHFKGLELEILDGLGNLDEALDGELVHSENWQALNTLQRRYRERVKCIYIDPPYNTGDSEILYKNTYIRSSWLTLMANRLAMISQTLMPDSVLFIAIDDFEMADLAKLVDTEHPSLRREMIIVNHHPQGGKAKTLAHTHEYMLVCVSATSDKTLVGRTTNDSVEERPFKRSGTAESNFRYARPNSFYALLVDMESRKVVGLERPPKGNDYPVEPTENRFVRIYPIDAEGKERVWRRSYKSCQELVLNERLHCSNGNTIYQIIKAEERTAALFSNWTDTRYNAGTFGANLLRDIMGKQNVFSYPKSLYTVRDAIFAANLGVGAYILDCFAGSGTTAHAVIDLNREDEGHRKYLLIEMGNYFHTVLLPRIKKVVYSKDWKDGKPVSREGVSHFLKYYTLEQYEETLRNSRYEDGEQLALDSAKSPFEQYIFFGDDKLAHVVKPQKNGKLKINLHNLYPDIDIAESLANILGKHIRKRAADSVTFEDGSSEKTDPITMTEEEKRRFVSLMKPYLWWGE